MKKVGFDVDGTLVNFADEFIKECWEKHQIALEVGSVWNFFDQDIKSYDVFKNLTSDFWLNLKKIPQSYNLNIIPSAYISHRNIPEKITKKCLKNNGFPDAPVIHVANTEDKIKVIKQLGIDIFVDDRASTILFCLENSIEAYLIDQIWNEQYTCIPRIKTLGELDSIVLK